MEEETLMRAARTDVVNESGLKEELENYNSNSLEEGLPEWLLVACQRNSYHFLKVVSSLVPGIGWCKDENGYTAMHFTCSHGHVESTQLLTQFDPTLCLLKDKDGRIPLHVAVAGGNGKVALLKVLLVACPNSLERETSLKETVLHQAARSTHCGCFKFLFKEVLKRKQGRDLLNQPDSQGDTVLHIATTLKRIQILKLMLSGTHKRWVEVNAKNGSELTALDLLYGGNQRFGRHDKDISGLLHAAGAKEGCQIISHERPQPDSASLHLFVGVLSLFAAGVIACISNFPSIFQMNHNQVNSVPSHVGVMISQPLLLPTAFYFLVMMNAVFIVSMVAILCVINFRGVVIFLTATTCFAYALLVKNFVPDHILVTTGSHNISSFLVVWLYALALILLYFFANCFIMKLIPAIIFSIINATRRRQVEYIDISEENVDEEKSRIITELVIVPRSQQ